MDRNKYRYKVLPLSFPDKRYHDYWKRELRTYDEQIVPIFDRDGMYYDRFEQKCWIEVSGEAWLYSSREYFYYSLSRSYGNNRIEPRLYDALRIVQSFKLSTKTQDEICNVEHDMRMFRLNNIITGLHHLKRRKEKNVKLP